MTTQAQMLTATLIVYVTWQGGDDLPIPPDATHTFVTTTGLDPQPEAGDVYDPSDGSFSTP
jgi:hypothetical protein